MSDFQEQQDQQDNMTDAETSGQIISPGEMLMQKREQAGLSHATVGDALHLTIHYIKALENNEYGKLPGQTFVKGYIKSYAGYLKMDVPAVIVCYEAYLNSIGVDSSNQYGAGMRKRSDQTLLWAVAAGVVLIIALLAGWWFFGRSDSTAAVSSTTVSSSSPRPVSTATGSVSQTRTTTPSFNVDPVVQTATVNVADEAQQLSGQIRDATGMDELVAVVAASSKAANTDVTGTSPEEAGAAPDTLQATALDSQGNEPGVASQTMISQSEVALDEAVEVTDQQTGPRRVNLLGEGNDLLEFALSGESWIEVAGTDGMIIFQDMLAAEDTLSIRGTAPFNVLLGDARNVSVRLNTLDMDFSSDIRSDNTARIELLSAATSAGGER